MATEKQIAANQANAKLSHGPVTEAGRIAAEINAFRHGLAVKTTNTSECSMTKNKKYSTSYSPISTKITRPRTKPSRFSSATWLNMSGSEPAHSAYKPIAYGKGSKASMLTKFALFMRYQTTHERAFHASLNQLQSLRKQERNMEIGIESQRLKQAAEIRSVESQNLRREQFEFKKEVYQARKVAVKAPVVPSGGLKMAA